MRIRSQRSAGDRLLISICSEIIPNGKLWKLEHPVSNKNMAPVNILTTIYSPIL